MTDLEGEWTLRAACRGSDDPVFFPTAPGRGDEARIAVGRWCSGCPVRRECLADARLHKDRCCVRGGVYFDAHGREHPPGPIRRPNRAPSRAAAQQSSGGTS